MEKAETIKEETRQLIINYKENEWLMNGADVEKPKSIDVSMNFYKLSETDVSSKLKTALGDQSLIIEFPENGQLPGTTLIRIKDEDVSQKLESDKYYIYYVDEDNNMLSKVALEIQKSYDGYIEFYINHNSKYAISSKEVTDTAFLGEDDNALENNTELKEEKQSNKEDTNKLILYVLMGIGSLIVLLLIIIIIMLVTKKTSSKTSSSQDETPKSLE